MKRLALSAVASLLLPGAFLAVYVGKFGAPNAAVLLHGWALVIPFMVFVGARLALTALLPDGRLYRAFSTLILAGAICVTAGFYGTILIGLAHWSHVPTTDLIATYLHQAPALAKILGINVWLAVLPAILLFSGILACSNLYLKHFDWAHRLKGKTSAWLRVSLALALIWTGAMLWLTFPDKHYGRSGEPVSLFFFSTQNQTLFQSHSQDSFDLAKRNEQESRIRDAYKPNPTAHKKNVVLIVSDALRPDHLSLFGYPKKTTPFLDTLVKDQEHSFHTSIFSVCNESLCGLRALAASRYLDEQVTEPITFHEILKKHGYRVNLIFSGDHVNFYGLSQIYGTVDSYHDGSTQSERFVNDDRLILDRLKEMSSWNGVPTMFQFHLMSTHSIGKRFETTPSFGPETNYSGFRWGSSDAGLPQKSVNYYDRGVLQMDSMVAAILEKLQALQYLKDAIVVITGDHGESLGEHGLYSHSNGVWEQSIRVPLIIINYGAASEALTSPKNGPLLSSQVDIAPTLLDVLDMPQPSSWKGVSLKDIRPDRIIKFQQGALVGVVDGRDKRILYKHWIDLRTGEPHTFDLISDPGEIRNISAEVPPAVRAAWRQTLGHEPISSPQRH